MENVESVQVQMVPKNTNKSTSWATTVWINWTEYRDSHGRLRSVLICNTRSNRFVLSWPMMCFSSYSSEQFELRQILHPQIRRRTKRTWFRQHIHHSDKNQDPILFLKPPVCAQDKTNHQTCCYIVSLDCIIVQASYPLRTSVLSE